MKQTELARAVAAQVRREDRGVTTILYFPHHDSLRLLQVCPSWPDSLGPYLSRQYQSSPELGEYRCEMFLVNAATWRMIRQGKRVLPNGWDLYCAVELLPTEDPPVASEWP